MRKVLFVHNGPLHRDRDGAVYGIHYTEAIKQRYLELGDHVTFLMREASIDGPAERFSKIEPDRFDFVPVPDLMSPSKRLLNHRRAMRIIADAVDAADLVVARIPSLTARLAIGRARKRGTPCLVECVACNWDALWNHGLMGKLSAPWYALMQRRTMRKAEHAIYVTEEFLQRRYPTAGRSIGISDVQLPEPDRELLARRLECIDAQPTRQSIRLVTVADVAVRYKGQGDIFPAIAKLRDIGRPLEYHLVGGGDPSRLKKLASVLGIEDRIIFHGVVQQRQLFDLLERMDVYVQPSHQEGLPRAIVEAMSLGMPVLGTSTGGIPELIPTNRVFRAGRADDFSAALEKLLSVEEQTKDARRNFSRALDFRRDLLAEKRRRFYVDFLESQGLGSLSLSKAPN